MEKKKFTAKKVIYIILGILFLLLLIMGVRYLINSNASKKDQFLTKTAIVQNMDDKVLATGTIVPREEIEIKPNVAGIIDKILVKEGDHVTAGQLIAIIRIIPNLSQVNDATQQIQNAQLQISNAKMNIDNQQKQFAMQQKLYTQGVISKQEYITSQQQLTSTQQVYKNAKQQLNTAQKQLQIVRTGANPDLQGLTSTQCKSKV